MQKPYSPLTEGAAWQRLVTFSFAIFTTQTGMFRNFGHSLSAHIVVSVYAVDSGVVRRRIERRTIRWTLRAQVESKIDICALKAVRMKA